MTLRTDCPGCGAAGMRAFYEAAGVPRESSIVLEEREEALAVRRADIVLGFCRACGFIANMAHPPQELIPSRRYEDQQGFSGTFAAFAERIADEIATRYPLAGKTVVEVGCGKGDFLALLCRRGGCRGVGVDPLFDGSRLPEQAGITAVSERYSVGHARYRPDVVVCRHTLEHIPLTRRFLETIRDTMEEGAALVVEVPDTTRILAEGAFWDVYYEHCSYFEPGSLRRVLVEAGFEVETLRREYRDQYLVAFARAARRGDPAPERSGGLETAVEGFARQTAASRGHWQERLGESAVIWGSGSKCVAFVTTLGAGERIAGIVDINPNRHGLYMPGIARPVEAPEALPSRPPRLIVAMNPVYRGEIEASVRSLGLDSEVVALGGVS